MNHHPPNRPDLYQELLDASKQQSTLTILYHQAVAKYLDLNITDHKCLDIVLGMGKATAGQLAELTGLTTGAITSVLNRLEKAGFVRRVKDLNDLRMVIVEPVYANLYEVKAVFAPLTEDMTKLYARYSPDELRVILDYMKRSNQILVRQSEELRKKNTNRPRKQESTTE